MEMKETLKRMKRTAPMMASSTNEERNAALLAIKEALLKKQEEIFAANAKDLAAAEELAVTDAVKKRLKFDGGKLSAVTAGIDQLISLPDPVGKVLLDRDLDEGLRLRRISCPIGVIGVIFEARPDALVQISTLCIKSGNSSILKGGKETANTNRVLFDIIYAAVVEAGLPEGVLALAETHDEIDELLNYDEYVDLLIPRGSNAFVQYIMEHTKIPVMGHADGVCHVYIDRDADEEKALSIVPDAKMQYTAVCNAAETLLLDRAAAKELLPKLADALKAKGVKLWGDETVQGLIEVEPMAAEDYHREYLEPEISVKLVDGVKEAAAHINAFGSHHTDAIITENRETAEYFVQMVDSANVFINCSTRFSDGFRYGFGAEVGISTSKLHARGPVGLEGLMTYKYRMDGSGQTVAPYADGTKEFHFKDRM